MAGALRGTAARLGRAGSTHARRPLRRNDRRQLPGRADQAPARAAPRQTREVNRLREVTEVWAGRSAALLEFSQAPASCGTPGHLPASRPFRRLRPQPEAPLPQPRIGPEGIRSRTHTGSLWTTLSGSEWATLDSRRPARKRWPWRHAPPGCASSEGPDPARSLPINRSGSRPGDRPHRELADPFPYRAADLRRVAIVHPIVDAGQGDLTRL
jgi:hypothetical protein